MNFIKSCFFAQRFHDEFRLDEFDLSQHFVFMFKTANGRIFMPNYDQDNKMFLLEMEVNKDLKHICTCCNSNNLIYVPHSAQKEIENHKIMAVFTAPFDMFKILPYIE